MGMPLRLCRAGGPLPQFELQAKLVARVLSGRAALPSRHDMWRWVNEEGARLRREGIPEQYAHLQVWRVDELPVQPGGPALAVAGSALQRTVHVFLLAAAA